MLGVGYVMRLDQGGLRMGGEKIEGLCPSSTPAGNLVSCTFVSVLIARII
jgi:hypothetical protein